MSLFVKPSSEMMVRDVLSSPKNTLVWLEHKSVLCTVLQVLFTILESA